MLSQTEPNPKTRLARCSAAMTNLVMFLSIVVGAALFSGLGLVLMLLIGFASDLHRG